MELAGNQFGCILAACSIQEKGRRAVLACGKTSLHAIQTNIKDAVRRASSTPFVSIEKQLTLEETHMTTIAHSGLMRFPRKIWNGLGWRIKNILSIIGLDVNRLAAIRHYPRYLLEARTFKNLGGLIATKYPIFIDYHDQAGSASGHYFHQDLLVASFIFKCNPQRHVDIGSRIDGFVAHVATFRPVDVMDVRELQSTGHENISFIKADLMDPQSAPNDLADSISCLHAIEHFGLGRYGEPIDPQGHIKGFNNMIRMLKCDGKFYISFPIGRSNEVHFNAHRIFHPKDIFSWANDKTCLKLERFDYVDDAGSLRLDIDIEKEAFDIVHGCGIYTFRKLH